MGMPLNQNIIAGSEQADIFPPRALSPWYDFWCCLKRRRASLLAIVFLLLLLFIVFFAPYLVPYNIENYFDFEHASQNPSREHWLGLDASGRDVFSCLLLGARITVGMSLIAIFVAGVVGTVLGLLAGYYSGVCARVIMGGCHILFAFPSLLLAIIVMMIMGNGIMHVIIAVSLLNMPRFVRFVYGNTQLLKRKVYVESARSIGVPNIVIILRHVLPGTLPLLAVYSIMRVGTSIIIVTSLSFIKLGVPLITPEWGGMLHNAFLVLDTAPQLMLPPALAIFLTVVACNYVGGVFHNILNLKLYAVSVRLSQHKTVVYDKLNIR